MANKILIFGATGAVGSSLAKLMQSGSTECHLVGKNQDEVSKLSDETGHSFSVADVLEEGFLDKIDSDLADTEIKGIAYCVGSIDLKPINLISKKKDLVTVVLCQKNLQLKMIVKQREFFLQLLVY